LKEILFFFFQEGPNGIPEYQPTNPSAASIWDYSNLYPKF